jgi:hypothetical protein
VPAAVGARAKLPEQPRLADPGLTDERQRRRPSLVQPVEDAVDRAELGRPSDEVSEAGDHAPPRDPA